MRWAWAAAELRLLHRGLLRGCDSEAPTAGSSSICAARPSSSAGWQATGRPCEQQRRYHGSDSNSNSSTPDDDALPLRAILGEVQSGGLRAGARARSLARSESVSRFGCYGIAVWLATGWKGEKSDILQRMKDPARTSDYPRLQRQHTGHPTTLCSLRRSGLGREERADDFAAPSVSVEAVLGLGLEGGLLLLLLVQSLLM